MPIRIKNPKSEELARNLAARETVTGTIQCAAKSSIEVLTEIAAGCAARPVLSDRTADEILGYDDFGVPARFRRPGDSSQ